MAALGVVNGVLREVTYAGAVGDHTAHQLSTFTLIAMMAAYVWWLQQRWPLTSMQEALRIGALWAAMTVVFEFGFGHYVDGAAWSTLLADYDITRGNLWILVLLTIGSAPELVRRSVVPARRAVEHSPKGG